MRAKTWIALVLLVMLLACTACGPQGGGNTPQAGGEATPQEEARTTPQAGGGANTPQPGGAGGKETPAGRQPTAEEVEPTEVMTPTLEVSSDALAGLDSYRTRLITAWTPESGTPERFEMQEEFTREPPAHRLLIESAETQAEFVQIGDTTWYCSEGQCAQFQGDAADAISGLGLHAFDSDAFVNDRAAKYAGQETVNGIRTRHYVVTVDAAEAAILAKGEVTDVRAEVWVADQADLPVFVVRYVQSWKEKRGEVNGTDEYSFEMYDVNQPITISPPEGATGMPEDIPAYQGAKDLFITEGFISFSTSDDVATVVSFYGTELPANGWSKESEQEISGSSMTTWKKDSRTIDVMVSPGDDGATKIVISIQ